ncbi:hypothetical protein Tco_1162584 [Tanacetum coccineum]
MDVVVIMDKAFHELLFGKEKFLTIDGKLVKESYPWVEKQVMQKPCSNHGNDGFALLWKEFQTIILEGYGDVIDTMTRLRGRFAYPLVYELPGQGVENLAIIGSGPAGVHNSNLCSPCQFEACSVFRQNYWSELDGSVVVFEGYQVENFPGFQTELCQAAIA